MDKMPAITRNLSLGFQHSCKSHSVAHVTDVLGMGQADPRSSLASQFSEMGKLQPQETLLRNIRWRVTEEDT